MPTVEVWNLKRECVGTLTLSDEVFGQESRMDLVSEVVRNQLARMRKGTAKAKTRGEVAGTGKKPFKQKHSGRARQGSIRSPIQPGGGAAFGPKPRSYKYTMPKKVRKQALRSLLSHQAREKKLVVVKDFDLQKIATKQLAQILKVFGLEKGMLVDRKDNRNLALSARNLAKFRCRPTEGLNLVDLLKFENLMISEAEVKKLEGELMP